MRKRRVLSEEHKRKIGEASRNKSVESRKKLSDSLKGHKLSEETKQKISKAHKGKKYSEERIQKMKEVKLTEEHKKKLSIALSGKNNPNYGKKHSPEVRAKISAAITGRKLSEETKKKFSEQRKGKKKSEEHRRKISESNKGKTLGRKFTDEQKQKLKEAAKRKNLFGKNNPAWKGGISLPRKLIRESTKYAEWRQNVFIRDNFTCQKCGSHSNLEAHHIKPFQELLEEVQKYLPLYSLYDGAMIYTPLWDIDNGVTLCKSCHKLERKKN